MPHLAFKARVVAGHSDPAASFVVGRNTVPSTFPAGSRITLMVIARDKFRNPRERGGEDFNVKVALIGEDEDRKQLDKPIDGFENVTRALATRLTAATFQHIQDAAARHGGGEEGECIKGGGLWRVGSDVVGGRKVSEGGGGWGSMDGWE